MIGGTSPSARNVISGNGVGGIELQSTAWDTVQGNYIGVGVDGNAALSNGADGIEIVDAILSYIGGTVAGAGNVIAYNGARGVNVRRTYGTPPAQGDGQRRDVESFTAWIGARVLHAEG